MIQAGMVYVSGAKLAAASANAGILGLLGAGSMKPDLLEQHILKAKSLTSKPFGINIPLLYDKAKEQIDTALKHGIKIFFTSAGSPKLFTSYLKDQGCIVVHVATTPELAQKCETSGCDAIVAEGFEAGGHNGRDEITTMVLIPQVVDAVSIPVIAAGGIADGRGMLAAFSLGAHGVQIGTRFAASLESSAHENFKTSIIHAKSQDTFLCMKKLVPVRLLKNKFFETIHAAEEKCATTDELKNILGKGRAKKGMLEGDIAEGELEVGQNVGLIHSILSVKEIVQQMVSEYESAKSNLF